MSDYEKACIVLSVLERIDNCRVVKRLTPDDIIRKCQSSAELHFWYQKLCNQ